MKKYFVKHKFGFTLIELLVVTAIITILAGMLIGVVMSSKEKAKKLHCMNNLRQIGIAIKYYSDEHNNRYPSGYASTAGVPLAGSHEPAAMDYVDGGGISPGSNLVSAFNSLSPYITADALWCPSAAQTKRVGSFVTTGEYPFTSRAISYTMAVNKTDQYSLESAIVTDVIAVRDPNQTLGEEAQSLLNDVTPDYNHKHTGVHVLTGDNHAEFVEFTGGSWGKYKPSFQGLIPSIDLVGFRYIP